MDNHESKYLKFLLDNSAPSSHSQNRTSSQKNARIKNAQETNAAAQRREERTPQKSDKTGSQRLKTSSEKENHSSGNKKAVVDSHDRSEDYTPIYEEDDHFSGVASATVTLDSRGNTVEIATHSCEKGARKQLSPRERKSTNKRTAHEEEEKIHHVYNSPAKRYVPAPNQYAHFGNQIDCAVKAQAANPKRYSGVTSSKTSKPGSAGKK